MTVISFTESEQKDLSIKPKLLVCTTCFLYGFAVIVAYRSSLKNAKYFHIPKIRRNMLRNLNRNSHSLKILTHFSIQLGESYQGNLSANSGGFRGPMRQRCGGVILLQQPLHWISDMVDLPLCYNHNLHSSS